MAQPTLKAVKKKPANDNIMPLPHQKSLERLPSVKRRTGLSKSSVYSLQALGKFPQSVKIGRSTLWVSEEIDAFIDERIQERPAQAA